MRFLLSWLGDFVDLAGLDDPRAIADQLTAAGLAVEAVERAADGEIVLDVDVTSNRPDAMCHFGLARELAVILGRDLRRPELRSGAAIVSDGRSGRIALEDAEGCPRYVARRIRGVRVGPSPAWLVRRLAGVGSRSINNVVDATNYVLWESGQPLHGFDFATVPGGEIRVRRARDGERLVTLDGRERVLDPEVLVIADRERAIALAGIMGGLATEVTTATTEVLLESAHFDRKRVRIGAKRLGMHTDASHRFERGADFEACDAASRRCAELIVELAGGEIVEPAEDAIARRPARVEWTLDARALERFGGVEVETGEVEAILGGLGFEPVAAGERIWTGTVPAWREVDFEPRRTGADRGRAYPQDLFEEVLRHVGYGRVPATLPALGGFDEATNPAHARAMRARELVAQAGYAEAIHYAFQPLEWDARFPRLRENGSPLALANPLSERYAALRRSLVPNLVAAAEANANRGAALVRLFEVGHLFPGGEAVEREAIAWVAGGAAGAPWEALPAVDLFTVKGVAELLAEELGQAALVARAAELAGVVDGTGAWLLTPEGATVGWFGRIAATEMPFPLFAGELLLDRLPEQRARRAVAMPSRLPGISADLTLTHPLAVAFEEIARAIEGAAVDLLVGFRLKERWQGKGVPDGAVATTLTLDYHGGERTLTQDEVNARHGALRAELERRFGVARGEESR